jgi:hypothetical protein
MKSFNVEKLKNELEENLYKHKSFIDGIIANRQDKLLNGCSSNYCKDMAKLDIRIFSSFEEKLITIHKSFLTIFEEVTNTKQLHKYELVIKLSNKLLNIDQYISEMLENLHKGGYSISTLDRYKSNVSESIKQMERFIQIDGDFISMEIAIVQESDKEEKDFLMLHIKNK